MDQDCADLELHKETAATLHAQVASMNLKNFLVRPKRRIIEQYLEPAAWNHLDHDDLHTLATEVAGLPSESEAEDEDAKRFDMLLPRLQLALLRHEPSFGRLRDTVVENCRAAGGAAQPPAHPRAASLDRRPSGR